MLLMLLSNLIILPSSSIDQALKLKPLLAGAITLSFSSNNRFFSTSTWPFSVKSKILVILSSDLTHSKKKKTQKTVAT